MFSYDLEFTVAHNLVAVSTGSLLYQVEMNDINVLEFESENMRVIVFKKMTMFPSYGD